MPCYKPIEAWYAKTVNESGKRSLVFSAKKAEQPDAPIEIACGQCVGCRLERSRQWAMRCIHEASLYERNCFITLTFDNESLFARENPFSIDVREYQLFMKRLRKQFGDGIRFFHCGEYGDKSFRPHYHALLFNFDFEDKTLWSIKNGHRLYVSETLSRLWPYGFCTIGDVTFDSAAYVARYVMKKVTGDGLDELIEHKHDGGSVWLRPYERFHDGEVLEVKPEYVTMSRRPGIGKEWFDKYKGDVYPKDYVTVNGKKMRPPKYYDSQLEDADAFAYDYIKDMRKIEAAMASSDNTRERLDVKEVVKIAQISQLNRSLDD